MSEGSFSKALSEQVANEFAAAQQYVAAAVYYDAQTLPRLAGFFYRQAAEERDHAMMMVRHLLDRDVEVEIPGAAQPRNDFASLADPVRLAVEQERSNTRAIHELARLARDSGDLAGEQFMQWFVKEQVEEEATMKALLTVVDREPSALDIEDFVAREMSGGGGDPLAPPAAGAGA